MRTLLLVALLAFGMSASAQDGLPDLNKLDFNNTRLWSKSLSTVIGHVDDLGLSGITDYTTSTFMGLQKDPTIGNYIFIGSMNDSISQSNSNLGRAGLKYYLNYNSFELTAPFKFLNKNISMPSSLIRIGSFDGTVASIPINYTPENSLSNELPIGTISFDNNFLYVRTSSGIWKRVALFEVEF